MTDETTIDNGKKTDSTENESIRGVASQKDASGKDVSQKAPSEKETFSEALAGFASVFVSGLFIITFVIQHFEIPSSSMENTLLIGDHVFVDRMTPTGKESVPLFPLSQPAPR